MEESVQAGSLVNVAESHFSKIKKDFVTTRPAPCFIVLLKTAGFYGIGTNQILCRNQVLCKH
jgi:hypothetical protein